MSNVHMRAPARSYPPHFLRVAQDKTPTATHANVWTHENRVSSDGMVKDIILRHLEKDAQSLNGKWARIDGQTKLGGIFRYDPFVEGSKVTTDGFDQVQLYNAFTGLLTYMDKDAGLGFDMDRIIGHAMVGHANAVTDMNAWYSPQTKEMTFGTSKNSRYGEWHLASDGDVVNHEQGHAILDALHPGLTGYYAREGGAIHEGFADGMAALFHLDPEVSEDFSPAIGRPESKDAGLRTCRNNLHLDAKDRDGYAGSEVHDRGRAYAGFFWDLMERLADPNGVFKYKRRDAANIVMCMMMNHGAFYTTNRPQPVDFVRAMLDGMENLCEERYGAGGLAIHLRREIIAEALERRMIKDASEVEPKKPEKISSIRDFMADFRRKNPYITFQRTDQVDVIGGGRDFYQQHYITRDGAQIRMMGAGFFAFRDAQGRFNGIARDDIRPVRENEINELRRIDLRQAYDLVRQSARAELQKAQREMKQQERIYLRDGAQNGKAYKEAQMNLRIAMEANRRAQRIHAKPPDSEMVILPGRHDIYYEVEMGLSLYYVNARTGKVTVEEDVFWS